MGARTGAAIGHANALGGQSQDGEVGCDVIFHADVVPICS